MKIISIYRPFETEPGKGWNAGLIIVQEPNGKKHELWDRCQALKKAAELSTGQELIHDCL